jgi:Uma2 family endonuclease
LGHYTRPADPPRTRRTRADTHAATFENREQSAYLKGAVERNTNMAANPERRYTLEEYLELDRTSEERLEFWDGEVFCMSGGSSAHERVIRNMLVHLTNRIESRGCEAFTSNIRIKVPTAPPYRYADVSALCGEATFEEIGGVDALVNPQLIVEVLSPSTEAYDRGEKFTHYKSIPTLREYLLVAQHRPHVTRLFKQDDGAWIHTEANEMEATLTLGSLGCELPLTEIYGASASTVQPKPEPARLQGDGPRLRGALLLPLPRTLSWTRTSPAFVSSAGRTTTTCVSQSCPGTVPTNSTARG